MLAELGFIITGVCFGVFAYTFKIFVIDKTKLELMQFAYAYFCLALALLTWGIAVAIGGDKLLRESVLLGDLFLLLGSLFMLDILLGEKNRLWLLLAGVLFLILFYLRTTRYLPEPYMRGDILIFNTQMAVSIGLAAMFLLIWLPVNLRVAKLVTRKVKQNNIATLYSNIYIAATFSALIFIAARRTITVVLSFIAIGICFAMLIKSNMLVANITEKHHGK